MSGPTASTRWTRRHLVQSAAGLVLVTGCGRLPGQAGEPTKMPRVGYLLARANQTINEEAFRQGLRELGYVEGQNLAVEWRSAAGRAGGLSEVAAEFVHVPVDVIVAQSGPAATAARQVSNTTPIV